VQARCTTGASAAGTANMVRRMPGIRTIPRASYSASSTSSLAHPVRAHADRQTVRGSVACSATIASAAAVTDAAGAAR
jgi:hypothetical protein